MLAPNVNARFHDLKNQLRSQTYVQSARLSRRIHASGNLTVGLHGSDELKCRAKAFFPNYFSLIDGSQLVIGTVGQGDDIKLDHQPAVRTDEPKANSL